MAQYGYPIGDIIDSQKLLVPEELDKIHLTPARPKFIVMGTKEMIFDWMRCYGHVTCEFDQGIRHITRHKSSHKFTTKNQFKISLMNTHKTLSFELYCEEKHETIIKKLFSCGSSKMKLVIKADYDKKSSSEYMKGSSITSTKGQNGIKLQDVLIALKYHPNHSKTRKCQNISPERLARVTCDYE
uniref:Lipoyl synthase, mitochondrial n=1 Tax=Anthurium amnicola TaxID=1678845 RepID=A0A1D1YVV7_9ARAE